LAVAPQIVSIKACTMASILASAGSQGDAPRRGEGPCQLLMIVGFQRLVANGLLHRLGSGGALQRCHMSLTARRARHNEGTGVLERCRWEVMSPYKGCDKPGVAIKIARRSQATPGIALPDQ